MIGRVVVALALALGGGCRRNGHGDAPPRSVPHADATAAAPDRAPGFAFPLEPASPTALDAFVAFSALTFARPVFVTHAPGDPDHVYVVEQAGRILRVPNRADAESFDVFLDVRDRVRMQHEEEGLLGLAFDPGYADNGHVYVYYSASRPRRTQLSRFVAKTAGSVDPSREVEILRIEQPYGNHNGGMIAFSPDGKLYVGIGDGGAAADPHAHGQNLGTWLGTILRITVGPDIPRYEVPRDNPFVDVAGAMPEIWAYGLRNPWRFSFDRQTGDLWCGDVGQNAIEEIDIVTRGGNYGWNLREGTHPFARGRADVELLPPIVEYGRDDGASVTGGYVYRGTVLADFRGMYIFGDYVTGHVWALDVRDGRVHRHLRVAHVPALSSFGEDADGELFAVGLGGRIYRFAPTDTEVAARQFPTRLSETGLFVDTRAMTPAPALVPYDVVVELWSDGAHKRRWLALPPDTTIAFHPTDAWRFPVGTIAVKHFELPADNAPRRLETRVMIHERRGWAGYTYRWNDAGTDAELVTTTTVADIALGPGRSQRWVFPAGADCLRCHTVTYGELLGVRTRQLAGDPKGLLAQLAATDRFEPAPDLATLATHPRISDESASANDRARAYLDVNCAICHHRGGPAPGGIDLRVDTPLADTSLLGRAPDQPLGIARELRVAPGDPDRSSLALRMARRDRHAMPPLASLRSDPEGIAIVQAWIAALASDR